jgi:thiamine transport system substrate-binding protein
MNRIRHRMLLAVVITLLAAACGDTSDTDTGLGGGEVVVMTHDSFAISDSVLDAFTAETGITVQLLRSGDAGEMLSQAILTKDNPLADVLYGVDNTFLTRALSEDLFEPHESAALEAVPAALRLDSSFRVTPIDFGDVCLNYDKAAFEASGLPIPQQLEDLIDPAYADLLVVQNPATSSPGLSFLLATIARFGDEWPAYWSGLRDNGVRVADGWETAYFDVFSGGGDGDRPLVVSYASSPPAEVVYAAEPITETTTGVIVDGCFRQIEFAGVLAGGSNPAAARTFIDFMLSIPFQEDIPLNMFVFPANQEAAIPAVFVEHTTIPTDPLTIDPQLIEQSRREWIEEWTRTVLG